MYLTLQEAADRLRISKQTIYNSGPTQYGGIKIGGLWRFPEERLGIPPEKPKEPSGYVRRFPNKGKGGEKMDLKKEKTAAETTGFSLIGIGAASVSAVNTLLANDFILTEVQPMEGIKKFCYSFKKALSLDDTSLGDSVEPRI